MAPAIDGAKYRPLVDTTDRQPVLVGIHRAESLQRREYQGATAMVAVGLAARKKDLQRLPFAQLNMLDPQPTQFVTPQRAPKTHQEQRLVPRRAQSHRRQIGRHLPGQPLNARFQPL
ncbi:hypothetical protein D3C85_893650 [compost metagenome]